MTDDLHFAQFRAKIREIVPEAEPAIMTIAEELRQEGRQQGREEGRVEGQREMLLELLRSKFGEVDDEAMRRIEAADEAALGQYSKRIFNADSVAAVLGG